MSKIYELTPSYLAVKAYINFSFRHYYSNLIVIGQENIPHDCPIIFAPNHTNALMDALAVSLLVNYPKSVVFLARADIFSNPMAAKILHFTKIMPAFRMRDGVKNLGKNQEIFDKSVEVLHQKHALCIMPEGNQEIERKLRPIVKGIFRIAFAAQEEYGCEKAVKIIPVGLDFGHLEKFGKHLLINIGKPIETADYMAEYSENQVSATNSIREKLRSDLSDLSFDLASEKNYYSFEKTVSILQQPIAGILKTDSCPVAQFKLRCRIAQQLVAIEKADQETANSLAKLSDRYIDLLNKSKLRENWFTLQSQSLWMYGLVLLIGSPVFALGFVLNIVPFQMPVWIRKYIFKAEFRGFFSSLQWATGAIFFPLWYLLMAMPVMHREGFFPAVLFLLVGWFSGKIALKYYAVFRKAKALYTIREMQKKTPAKLFEIEQLRGQIISLFQKAIAKGE